MSPSDPSPLSATISERFTLATAWDHFVDPAARSRSFIPFVHSVLRRRIPKPRILDLGAGTGSDALALLRSGHLITANEINPAFLEVLQEKAMASGLVLPLLSSDWRTLDSDIEPGRFNACLLVGNSLCLLSPKAERLAALHAIRNLLQPGGVLIIDERVFPRLISDFRVGRPFRAAARVLYCGETVRAKPVHLEHGHLLFEYRTSVDRRLLGHLNMYAFQDGELSDELGHSGFRVVSRWWDLGLGSEADADFVTYLAVAV